MSNNLPIIAPLAAAFQYQCPETALNCPHKIQIFIRSHRHLLTKKRLRIILPETLQLLAERNKEERFKKTITAYEQIV